MIDSQCICSRARRGARVLTSIYDEALWPARLNISQFSLLRQVQRMEPVTISQLAAATRLDRSTLARTLRPLEERQLISICPDPEDRRRRVTALSAVGVAAVAFALPYWEQAQRDAQACIGAHRRDTLFALLERIELTAA